jgi:uncharacterized protein (DUF952 family)
MTRLTYHLTPVDWWEGVPANEPLTAPSLEAEGFIHCTDGAEATVATANRHYRDDPRPFVVLTVDLDRITSPWRIDDPAGIYPHVFGPIDRPAILGVVPAPRDADGRFVAFSRADGGRPGRPGPSARPSLPSSDGPPPAIGPRPSGPP